MKKPKFDYLAALVFLGIVVGGGVMAWLIISGCKLIINSLIQ